MRANKAWDPCGLNANQLHALTSHIEQLLVSNLSSDVPTAPAPLGLLDWATLFLPEHFRLPASAMHRWLAERLDEMSVRRGMKVNVIGSRGSAKSTLATLALVLRAAVEGWEPYVWIVSDTRQQACGHLENVKLELLENAALAAAYPAATGQGSVWRRSAIVLRNGVMIEAFGTGQRIRGRRQRSHRPTLIVCDDLQNDQDVDSAAGRQRSRQWFHSALSKAGTRRTHLVHLATALHREALALELHAKAGWTSRLFRAIERWPANMELWQAWEAIYCDTERSDAAAAARQFYETNREEMDRGAEVLWPEEEDLYTLMCMRVTEGRTAFEREKQNSPINPELCEWPESYFGEWMWFDEWPSGLRFKTIALDPSKGADARRGDYSAYAMVGLSADGVWYVEADLARRPTPQIVADGVAQCRAFRPDALAIEANQFQQLLEESFAAEFERQGVAGIPVWSIDNRVNKLVRIRRLGPLLSARKLRFRASSASTRLLVDQLRDFPLGTHDDGPDALEMALRITSEITSDSHAYHS